jgi:hypothetical protein
VRELVAKVLEGLLGATGEGIESKSSGVLLEATSERFDNKRS